MILEIYDEKGTLKGQGGLIISDIVTGTAIKPIDQYELAPGDSIILFIELASELGGYIYTKPGTYTLKKISYRPGGNDTVAVTEMDFSFDLLPMEPEILEYFKTRAEGFGKWALEWNKEQKPLMFTKKYIDHPLAKIGFNWLMASEKEEVMKEFVSNFPEYYLLAESRSEIRSLTEENRQLLLSQIAQKGDPISQELLKRVQNAEKAGWPR